MANMKMVDVDEIVDKARALAEEHGWCDVVDDALAELGLVESNVYSGTVTLTMRVDDIKPPVGTKDVNKWFANEIATGAFASLEFYAPDYELIEDTQPEVKVDLSKDASNDTENNWWYTSINGRSLHYVAPGQGHWKYTSCGELTAVGYNNLVKTSPRGTGNKCKKCSKKHPE